MMHSLLLPLVVALFVFAYHYERNGDPLSLGTVFSRFFWGLSFSIGYTALDIPNFSLWIALLFVVTGYINLLIPHAWAQNMGRWATPQRRWPGFYLPLLTNDAWTVLKPWKRAAYDALGMLGVGFFRGLVVFVPPVAFGAHMGAALLAILLTAIGQPICYLIGNHVPLSIWGNVKNSATWGEFLIGISWALSLYVAFFWG